ncbi:MAG: TolB family protein, partial [Anaerolineales bacterium]
WAGRPWYSLDGKWIYFFTDVGEHRRICRIPAEGGQWEAVTPEGYPRSHGAFCDFDGEHLWFHSSRDGVASIYRFHLPSGHLEQVEIPGFPSAAHVTRDRSGDMTFDMRV